MSWVADNPEFFDEFVAKSVMEGKVGRPELLRQVEGGELFDYEIFAKLTEAEQMTVMGTASESFYGMCLVPAEAGECCERSEP